ncbi:myosin light chain kinase family member 4 isoform X1 [Pyrgilauda ruficollis]|uniref:myosin light chain kinase family member 4 isoform X1 n=1 Tax=Pyrgilauda ruficollis TaxID=221976 RepID=UPI001B86FC4E|nr:myosin light chain kinase family member 4 isoform X1 [Pyrgilauda ruficollis]XP_041331271.1 myosin light chain kinase family member 4 isoform X1 [Pyrgilauda ruficollis]
MTTSSRQSSSTSMVNNLAKIFDPNTLQNQGPGNGMEPPQILHVERSDVSTSESFNVMDVKFASLEEKIDKLLTLQDNVLKKLNSVSQEICCIEKDMEMVKAETSEPGSRMERNKKMRNNEMKRLCLKMKKSLSDINRKAEQQVKRLDGLEQSVSGLQKLVGPLVEKVKTLVIHNSSVKHHVKKRKVCKAGAGHPFRMHIFSETTAGDLLRKKNDKVIKEKSHFNETETKEKKPPDSTDGDIQQSQSCSQEEEVDKLNKENAKRECSLVLEVDPPKFHSEGSEEKQETLSLESHYEYRRNSFQESFTPEKQQEEDVVDDACQKLTVQEKIESESPAAEEKKEHQVAEDALEKQQEEKECAGKENADKSEKGAEEPPAPSQKEDEAEQCDDEEVSEGRCKSCEKGTGNSSSIPGQTCQFENSSRNDIPTPPAPFDHRIVSAKRVGISNYYNVNEDEILGGGRFGQVHKCEEKATGLKLAAKIIKAQGPKQKDEVKNEINVMNQLNHVNLIQLYDAFESKNDIVLVMEYVEGGELFDRIIDENYNLTEMDTISFIKQICKGIQYMHQMYILHLDLKPENILCVNREANQIKIIDFGLARRYKPREKLRVNFGTPEFLAPEVVNYEFVSFPTDMWSLGVIAYMLLTGLSPFLGDDDNETLNNILACNWDFEDEEFRDVSDEAKDFISKLLIKEKCWRLSAAAALKHPWLTDHKLHCRLQRKAKGDCVSQAPLAK